MPPRKETRKPEKKNESKKSEKKTENNALEIEDVISASRKIISDKPIEEEKEFVNIKENLPCEISQIPLQDWPESIDEEDWFSKDRVFTDADGIPRIPNLDFDKDATMLWMRPVEFLEALEPKIPQIVEDPSEADTSSKDQKKKRPKAGDKKKEVIPDPVKVEPIVAYVVLRQEIVKDTTDDPDSTTTTTVEEINPLPTSSSCHNLFRDFRRKWSNKQLRDLRKWNEEEKRIERKKEALSTAMMRFEEEYCREIELAIENDDNTEDEENDEEMDCDDDIASEEAKKKKMYDDINGRLRVLWQELITPEILRIPTNKNEKPMIPEGDHIDAPMAGIFELVDSFTRTLGPNVPYLWEAIYPQDENNQPIYNPGGKYSVKLYVNGKWRKVDVDDRLPVDEEGKIGMVSSVECRELWPSLLAKAVYKVLAWTNQFNFDNGLTSEINGILLIIEMLTCWFSKPLEYSCCNDLFERCSKILRENIRLVKEEEKQYDIEKTPLEEGSLKKEVSTDEDDSRVETVLNNGDAIPQKVFLAVYALDHIHEVEFSSFPGQIYRLSDYRISTDPNEPSSMILLTSHHSQFWVPAEEFITLRLVPFAILTEFELKNQDFWDHEWRKIESENANDDEPSVIKNVNGDINNENSELACTIPSTFEPQRYLGQKYLYISSNTTEVPNQSDYYLPSFSFVGKLYCDENSDTLQSQCIMLIEDQHIVDKSHVKEHEKSSRLSDVFTISPNTAISVVPSSCSTTTLSSQSNISALYRIYPIELDKGYFLSVRSNQSVRILDIADCWKEIGGLCVRECTGAFSNVPSGQWTVILRKEIQWSGTDDHLTSGSMHIQLNLDNEQIEPYVHLYSINNDTNECVEHALLNGMESISKDNVSGYTVIVCLYTLDKAIKDSFQWRLIVGSEIEFDEINDIPLIKQKYCGTYTPNKYYICFRDMLDFSSLMDESVSMSNPTKLCLSIAIQFKINFSNSVPGLRIYDKSTRKLLLDMHQQEEITVYRLPVPLNDESVAAECQGYIIEGLLDYKHWLIPDNLRSKKPFYGIIPEDNDDNIEEAVNESAEALHWEVTIWSSDNVILTPDCTLANNEVAIKRTWVDSDIDTDAQEKVYPAIPRGVRGKISRLLFLEDHAEAKELMEEMGLSEENQLYFLKKYEYTDMSREKFMSEVIPIGEDSEVLRTPQDNEQDNKRLQKLLAESKDFVDQLDSVRNQEKSNRDEKLVQLKQSLLDWRSDVVTSRENLWRKREEMRLK